MDTTTSSNGSTAAEREREAEQKVIVNRFMKSQRYSIFLLSTPAPSLKTSPEPIIDRQRLLIDLLLHAAACRNVPL